MQCNFWMPCSKQRWQDELWFSIWWFFEQSAFVNIYLLWYWPTIHNLVSKICPKFQVFSSHFFEVNELLNVHWVKIVRSEIFSTPIDVECDKINYCFWSIIAFWGKITKMLGHFRKYLKTMAHCEGFGEGFSTLTRWSYTPDWHSSVLCKTVALTLVTPALVTLALVTLAPVARTKAAWRLAAAKFVGTSPQSESFFGG